jgi:hypothetical protein
MMHRTHVWRNLSPLPLLLAIVLAAGCSSQTQGQKMVESYSKTRDTLAESQTQVEITLAAMQHVRATPGERVHEAYRQYEDAVDALEKQAKDAAFRAKSMKEESDEHIRSWQEEMKSIKDRSIKASLESRRDAVRSKLQAHTNVRRRRPQGVRALRAGQSRHRAGAVDRPIAGCDKQPRGLDGSRRRGRGTAQAEDRADADRDDEHRQRHLAAGRDEVSVTFALASGRRATARVDDGTKVSWRGDAADAAISAASGVARICPP